MGSSEKKMGPSIEPALQPNHSTAISKLLPAIIKNRTKSIARRGPRELAATRWRSHRRDSIGNVKGNSSSGKLSSSTRSLTLGRGPFGVDISTRSIR